VRSLGQPATLREAGVKREQLSAVAAAAIKNRWVLANPQPIRTETDVMRLLEAAW
jgi:alcohol dehydrogenase class IV